MLTVAPQGERALPNNKARLPASRSSFNPSFTAVRNNSNHLERGELVVAADCGPPQRLEWLPALRVRSEAAEPQGRLAARTSNTDELDGREQDQAHRRQR